MSIYNYQKIELLINWIQFKCNNVISNIVSLQRVSTLQGLFDALSRALPRWGQASESTTDHVEITKTSCSSDRSTQTMLLIPPSCPPQELDMNLEGCKAPTGNECCICMDRNVKIEFQCRHGSCNQCYRNLENKCHICRKTITSINPID